MAYQTLAELNTGDVLPETWVDQVKENFEVLRGSAVTTLPTGFDNQVVRYKPNGAGSSPTWMCVFDEDLNGGVGAWSVNGPPLIGIGTATDATNLSTYVVIDPGVAVPVDGLYSVQFESRVRHEAGFTGRITVNGAGIAGDDANAAVIDSPGTALQFHTARNLGVVELTAGTITLAIRSTSGTFRVYTRSLTVTPYELRP